MSIFEMVLLGVLLLAIGLGVAVMSRADPLRNLNARLVSFAALVVLPLVALSGGVANQLEHSKSTEFCLSCHAMEPYGESLLLEEADHLPAGHYQNHLVPRRTACYECHTSYTMYGDLEAKAKGVAHLWVNYFGSVPDRIELYEPYRNRDCLRCHEQSRSFLEVEIHRLDVEALRANDVSCLDCHGLVHAVEELEKLPKWSSSEAEELAP